MPDFVAPACPTTGPMGTLDNSCARSGVCSAQDCETVMLGITTKTRRPDLTTCTVDGEVVIFDRAAGFVHQLNATASRIWDACDGTHSVEDIAAQLMERFEGT